MTCLKYLVVLERLSRADRRGEVVAVRKPYPPTGEPVWRVAILPEDQATLPLNAEMLQVDTVVSVIPRDFAITADAFAAVVQDLSPLGSTFPTFSWLQAEKREASGKVLVLKGVADPTMAPPVQQWIDTIRNKGFRTKSMLIVQLLQEIDDGDFGSMLQ